MGIVARCDAGANRGRKGNDSTSFVLSKSELHGASGIQREGSWL